MRNRIDIKEESKGIIRSARVSPLLVTAIVMAVTFLLNRVIDLVEGGSMLYSYQLNWEYFRAVMERDPYAVQTLLDSIPEITGHSFFFSTLVSLFTIVLNGGYYVYCMGIRRGVEMPVSTLLDGLGVAGKLIWCWIQISVRVALWSMLFVIPGLIAAYRYRFAYYNVLSDDALSAGDANEEGLSVLCTAGAFDLLITGDMAASTERELIAAYGLPDIEVLFAGHHGSKFSTSEELLEAVTPEAGVISVGARNTFGHPSREAMERMAFAGMTLYRTDEQGDIIIQVHERGDGT